MRDAASPRNGMKEFMIGKTKVKVHEDCSRGRTEAQIQEILHRISEQVTEELAAAAAEQPKSELGQ